jgi:beta-lactamase regulating signal transducer with metallopeptidase domain
MAIDPIVLTAASAGGQLVPEALTAGPDLSAWLFAVWLAGTLIAVALLLTRQAQYVASLGQLEPLSPGLFRAEHPGAGPAVVGALRPRIITPSDFEARFDASERQVILAHEHAHLARGDVPINALAAAAQCVCWFNPLMHVAAHLLRIDQELACDAAVLTRLPASRRLYAEVLLKTQIAHQRLPLGCHWPAGSEHPLKERIIMLKSPLPAVSRRAAGVAVVAALSLSAACAAWAANPRAPALITQPDWLAKPIGADLARFYPAQALKQGVTARALMSCRIDAAGRLQRCEVKDMAVTGENLPVGPNADMGFGVAMLQLAPLFQMKPTSGDGVATAGGEIRIPVRWTTPVGGT